MIASGLDTAASEGINLQGRCHSFELLCWMDGWTGWAGLVGISNIETSSPYRYASHKGFADNDIPSSCGYQFGVTRSWVF